MECPGCHRDHIINVWICKYKDCGKEIPGGVVFVTGISGSGVGDKLNEVVDSARMHGHRVEYHDVGDLMHQQAREDDPTVSWDRILDASPRVLRFLRAGAFREIKYKVDANPGVLHLIDLHLSFRWKVHLTKGFEPYLLAPFIRKVRCFCQHY